MAATRGLTPGALGFVPAGLAASRPKAHRKRPNQWRKATNKDRLRREAPVRIEIEGEPPLVGLVVRSERKQTGRHVRWDLDIATAGAGDSLEVVQWVQAQDGGTLKVLRRGKGAAAGGRCRSARDCPPVHKCTVGRCNPMTLTDMGGEEVTLERDRWGNRPDTCVVDLGTLPTAQRRRLERLTAARQKVAMSPIRATSPDGVPADLCIVNHNKLMKHDKPLHALLCTLKDWKPGPNKCHYIEHTASNSAALLCMGPHTAVRSLAVTGDGSAAFMDAEGLYFTGERATKAVRGFWRRECD